MQKKNKHILIGLSLALATTVIGSVILSSCTSTSSSSFAPYTSLNINTTNNVKFRYQTSNNEASYFNTGNLFGENNKNKYVTRQTIKTLYNDANKARVEAVLKDTNNWNQIKSLYGYNGTSQNKTFDNYYAKNKPSFFYGVSPTNDILEISKIYNEINILTSLFQYSATLSTRLMTYYATMSMPILFNGHNNFLKPGNPTINPNDINKYVLETIAGFGLTFGEGSNTYHLWPSGFTANITYDTVNGNQIPLNQNITSGTPVMDKTKTMLGDINAPFNIAKYTTDNKDIVLPTYKLNVSNVKVNYQWYKTGKNGGSYIENFQEVNKHLTKEQKQNLAKLGISAQEISSMSYELPISDLRFNLNPEYYSYQDPFYPGLYNSVTTGLYNISPELKYSPSKKDNINFANNPYPSELQTTIGTNQTIDWRGIVGSVNLSYGNLDSKKDLIFPESFFNSIKDKKLDVIPYFQKNMIFTTNKELPPYEIKTTSNQYLTPFNVNQVLSLFLDPYNINSTYVDKIVYNNVNDLTKNNYLGIYMLGWLWSNPTNTTKINELEIYKILKSDLGFKNNKVDINNFYNDSNKYYSTYKSGLNAFYSIVDFDMIKEGVNYKFNSNGIVIAPPITFNKDENIK